MMPASSIKPMDKRTCDRCGLVKFICEFKRVDKLCKKCRYEERMKHDPLYKKFSQPWNNNAVQDSQKPWWNA